MIDRVLVTGENKGTVICPTGAASGIVSQAWLSVRCDGGGRLRAWFQKSADTDANPPGAGNPVDVKFKHSRRAWFEVPSGCEYIQFQVDAFGPGALAVEMKAR